MRLRRRRKLLLNDLLKCRFWLRPTQKNPIDEKTRCSARAHPHSILAILLNLSLIFFAREARRELLFVQ